jgi:hypothetical protein
LGQQLVRRDDDGPDHALAGVVLVAPTPGGSREDEVVRLGPVGGVAVDRQLVAERGEDVDEPDAGLGLRVSDRDPAVGEVDVLPEQGRGLADTQAGVDERRDQRAAAGCPSCGLGVELRGGVDQGGDLLGRLEVDRPLALGLELRFRVLTRY